MMQPPTMPLPMGAPPAAMDHHRQQPPPPYQQPWMMMMQQGPPPPPAQVAPPPPMWNPQQQQPPPQMPQALLPPQPQPQQQQLQYSHVPPTSADDVRTLWIGDLHYWMDENYIHSCFVHTGEVRSVKLIRNKQTNQLEGYGFIEFTSRAAAERVLQTLNGTLMPSVEQNFRLNWASFGMGEKQRDDSPDFTIFVGDLAADVTDYMLQETFRAHYPSVKGAKVVTDKLTGRTKGYGFVRFGDESEQLSAMTEMNGRLCSTRPMRIGPATNKKTVGGQQFSKASYQSTQDSTQNENDPNNTTIFVGGLDSSVTEDHLRQLFSKYGELVHVKIPVGKRCGFVQFAIRSCAEEALHSLNGLQLGGQNIRLSWGRSPSNKLVPQQDPNTVSSGYYGYAQGYETYGYAPAPQDPNMYYGSYTGYANYQQQPQPQPQQLQ